MYPPWGGGNDIIIDAPAAAPTADDNDVDGSIDGRDVGGK